MSESKKSVGVIGLGPAGLVMVKELKASGSFGIVRGFDRCSRVGGRWSLDRATHNAGIWKELCANTTRRHMEFSDFPWDAENRYEGHERAFGGIYPHCTETLAYLEAYARNFDLYPHLNLQTEVISIEQTRSGNGWTITTTSSQRDAGDEKATHHFDAIIVCNGAQARAYHPLETKFQNFAGQVLHARDFLSKDDFNGKRVLVIGGNVSGSEIASLLAENLSLDDQRKGCHVVHSIRKMPYHIQKFSRDGRNACYNDDFFIRLTAWLQRILPDWLVAMGLKLLILLLWPKQTYQCSIRTPNCSVIVSPDIRKCGATVSKNYVDTVQQGILTVKPEVSMVNGSNIQFADGSTLDFDAIICATGYDFDMSFLPDSVSQKIQVTNPTSGKQILVLYKDTLVPCPQLVDRIAFCGLVNSLGPYFPLVEIQARYITAVWSGSIPCPTEDQRKQNAIAMRSKRLDTSNILNQYVVSTIVNEDLGDELGVTPTFAKAISNPKKYLVGPVYSCYYRTNSEAPGGNKRTAEICSKRFDSLVASSPQVWNPSKDEKNGELERLVARQSIS